MIGSALGIAVDSVLSNPSASILPSGPLRDRVSQESAEADGPTADFLARAQAEIPALSSATLVDPQTVKPVRDTAAYLRW